MDESRQLRRILFVVVILSCVTSALSCFELFVMATNRIEQKMEYVDLQRSMNSYDYLMRPLISLRGPTRVTLFKIQYNNSVAPHTLSNIVLNKTNEVAINKLNTGAQNLIVVPIGIYAEILPDLLEHKIVAFDVSSIKFGPLRESLESKGVIKALWMDVSDQDDNVIGMLAAEWSDKDKLPNEARYDEIIKQMQDVALRIGKTMSSS